MLNRNYLLGRNAKAMNIAGNLYYLQRRCLILIAAPIGSDSHCGPGHGSTRACKSPRHEVFSLQA